MDTTNPQDLSVEGDRLYVADETSMRIIDIADPSAPQTIGYFDATGTGSGAILASPGRVLMAASYERKIYALDVTDPGNIYRVDQEELPERACAIAPGDGFVCVADGASGLVILHAVWPRTLATLDTPGSAQDVVVEMPYAYVADGQNGLLIANVSDPESPWIVATLDTPGSATGVDVREGIVYLADYGGGLASIDARQPDQPLLLGRLDGIGYTEAIEVEGNRAFVGSNPDGLIVVDVSNPALPSVVGHHPTGEARAIQNRGLHIYVAAVDGVQALDATNPYTPAVVGHLFTRGSARGIDVRSPYVYLTTDAAVDSFMIVDVSNPTNPRKVGGCPGGGNNIQVAGDLAFSADGIGLRIFDIVHPTNPSNVGTLDTYPINWNDLVVLDDLVVGGASSGVIVADVSDPADPVLVGYAPTGYTFGVASDSSYAYAASGFSGIQVVDIRDPALPSIVGSLAIPGISVDVILRGGFIHVITVEGVLYAIDVSDPSAPMIVSSLRVPGIGFDNMTAPLDHAYISAGTGVAIVDLSNPAAPANVGGFSLYGDPYNAAVSGDCIYVADFTYDGGLWVAPRQCEGLGVPSPEMSSVLPWDTFGHALMSPGGESGVDEVAINLRDTIGGVLPFREVTIDLWDCRHLCVDGSTTGLTGVTNGNGAVTLDPRVGGCRACDVVIWADGVRIRTYPRAVSPDWNGTLADGVVDELDQSYFTSVFGTPSACADYDGDGWVGPADALIFARALNHDSNTGPCALDAQSVEEDPRDAYGIDVLGNPVGDAASGKIVITLSRGGPVSVELFDTAGRRSRVILEAALPAGRHVISWRGDGSGVGPGLWFLRIQGPDGLTTKKVTVIR